MDLKKIKHILFTVIKIKVITLKNYVVHIAPKSPGFEIRSKDEIMVQFLFSVSCVKWNILVLFLFFNDKKKVLVQGTAAKEPAKQSRFSQVKATTDM